MLVAKDVASYEERANLVEGDTVHRARYSDMAVRDYVRNTDNAVQDVVTSDETLVVNRSKHVSFIFDKLDEKQSTYNFIEDRSQHAGYLLANEMDQTVLDEVKNASYSADDGDIGGTPGNPITVSAANSANVFSTVKALMRTQNIEEIEAFKAVVTPLIASKIEQSVIASGFNTADATLKNGYAGAYAGLDIYVSNNLKHTTTNTFGAVGTANDTITIGGVVFTLKASATVAGDVAIGGSAAATAQNLTDAINATGTPGSSTYIAVSTANRDTLNGFKAQATIAGAVVTISTAGKVAITKSSTAMTLGTTIANLLFMKKGAIDVVDQIKPTTQMNKLPYQTGYNVLTYCLYGVKTFQEGKDRMYNVKVVG